MSSNTVEQRPPALPHVVEMYHRLEAIAIADDTDSQMVAMQIMDNVLSAETEADLFALQEASTTGSNEYLNRPFRLLPANVTFRKSNPTFVDQGGSPYYVIMRVTDMETGTDLVVTSGSYSVLAVVYKLLTNEGWDAFGPYIEDGGRPLQFVGKAAANGTVVMLKPFNVQPAAATRGKK